MLTDDASPVPWDDVKVTMRPDYISTTDWDAVCASSGLRCRSAGLRHRVNLIAQSRLGAEQAMEIARRQGQQLAIAESHYIGIAAFGIGGGAVVDIGGAAGAGSPGAAFASGTGNAGSGPVRGWLPQECTAADCRRAAVGHCASDSAGSTATTGITVRSRSLGARRGRSLRSEISGSVERRASTR